MPETAVDLSRPFTARRVWLYLTIAGGGSTVSALCNLGVGLDVLAPNRAVNVVGNLFSFLPMVLLPLVVWRCTAPGIGRAAELVLVWLPFTAAAQLSFGMELTVVLAAVGVLVAWLHLIRPALTERAGVQNLGWSRRSCWLRSGSSLITSTRTRGASPDAPAPPTAGRSGRAG